MQILTFSECMRGSGCHKMQLTGTHDGSHHQTKWNIHSLILYIRIPILSVSEKISISGGSGVDSGSCAWPLPSHFHSCPLGATIHQDPGRGHLPPAHKCMEQAIKLTLWQLFSHPFDGPVSAHPLQLQRNKKVKLGCVKNYDSGWGSEVRGGSRGGCS